MEISKEKIQEILTYLQGKPIFTGSDAFLLFGEIIETDKINTMTELLLHVFSAGQNSKIRQVKQVLNITDPRI